MDFQFSESQLQLADSVRSFAQKRLAGTALQLAQSPGYPWGTAKLLAEQNLLGLTIPERDGGQAATLLDAVVAMREIAFACPRSADVMHTGNFGAIWTFAQYASEELKQRFLPSLLAGSSLICVAMSEPGAGSAVTSLQTTARADGGQIYLNGTKVFATNSTDANVFLVYVRFAPGVDGIGSVVVQREAEGLEIGPPSEFMSGERWCELHFANCRIPAGNILLGPGGFKKQMNGFNVERIGNATRAASLGRLCFETARDHALQREQFGRKLCEFQGIQWKFAEMAVKLEAAELLIYRAASGGDGVFPSPYEASIAKLASNVAGFEAASEAMQVLGALGYSRESLVEYCFRRTRGWLIAGGSAEMMKNRIAESVFGRRFSQRG